MRLAGRMKNLHVPNQASEFPYFEHMSLSGQAELTADRKSVV